MIKDHTLEKGAAAESLFPGQEKCAALISTDLSRLEAIVARNWPRDPTALGDPYVTRKLADLRQGR